MNNNHYYNNYNNYDYYNYYYYYQYYYYTFNAGLQIALSAHLNIFDTQQEPHIQLPIGITPKCAYKSMYHLTFFLSFFFLN